MKKKFGNCWLAVMLAVVLAVVAIVGNVVSKNQALAAEEMEVKVLDIDSRNLYRSNNGIFEGWGTSLCWFGNRIGASEQTSDEAARLLCSDDEGLGLNIIRFNIGGGDDPTHDHITRTDSKMPGYWGSYDAETDTFTYDYTKDERQRNVLNKMLEQNDDLILEAFSNSPPYFMTISGCTSGTAEKDMADNLKEDKYDDFAEYLANVVKYYKENYGILFSSVEPMNENGWSIARNGNKQEGCTFMEGESRSKMILAMQKALENNGLGDVILAGCDESSPSETVTCLEKLSEDALNALDRIDTHTYSTLKEQQLGEMAQELSKNLWMSETDGGDIAGKKAGEMGAALAMANRIGYDMQNLQPSAWIMWQAIGSYCGSEPFDGNTDPAVLVQSELDTKGFWGVSYADMDQEKVVLTKKYYAFGQYTRYIHKGDYMITGDAQNTISYDKENNQLKIVAVNTASTTKAMKYDLTGFEWDNPIVKTVRTSGDMATGENWKVIDPILGSNNGFQAELAPNSVTTFIVKEPSLNGDDYPVVETPAPQDTTVPDVQMPVDSTQTSPVPSEDVGSSVQTTNGSVAKVTQLKLGKVTKNTAVLTWKKLDGAKYKIAYSTDKKKLAKIKNGSIKAISGTKVASAVKNTVTLKKLKKNTVYYVKVCAYQAVDGKNVYGKYSAVKKAKTKKK